MQPNPLVSALAVVLLPAAGLAAAQHPATSAHTHPATSAYAVATAGEANAKRIEACSEVSASMLMALAKGDYQSATADFDDQMRTLLDPQKLRDAWTSIRSQFGRLQSRGALQTVMYADKPVVVTGLHFDKGNLAAQVACNASGKIAGFYVRPDGAPPAAPPASGH